MAVLVSTLGLSPAIVTEMVDELNKRNISIEEVTLLTTKGAALSYNVLKLDFKYGSYNDKIRLENVNLPFDDIRNLQNCKTFRVIMRKELRKALKRAGDYKNVYVNLAGGRKTMPIDALLVSMALGIKNVYHVIAEEVSGIRNIRDVLSIEETKAIEDSVRADEKPKNDLIKKISDLLHPKGLSVHLVRIPLPILADEHRKKLREELF